MRTYEELKNVLTTVVENEYKIPDNIEIDGLLEDMLNFIGHPDYDFRDGLIYMSFIYFIEVHGYVKPAKMREMLEVLLSDSHLFYKIGENGTDSVFTRSFSALAIALAFCLPEETSFLSVDEVMEIKSKVLAYIDQEKDIRGYVEGKGWAHSVAHIADVMLNIGGYEINDKPALTKNDGMELLAAVNKLIRNREFVYATGEDERLVGVVISMLVYTKVLNANDVISWIDSFKMDDRAHWRKDTNAASFIEFSNCKMFMRSLYFSLITEDDYKIVTDHLAKFLIEQE